MRKATERRPKWTDTETRTCDACGQSYEAMVIHIFDTCPACSDLKWEARKADMESHAAERGYTIESFGGACPYQAEGLTHDGRPYYFRARHGDWTLMVGEPGGDPPYLDGELIASGDDPFNGWPEDDFVLPILDAHLSAP